MTLPDGKEPLAYDLHGRAAHVDLRRLPRDLHVPPAATDVNAEYHAAGSVVAQALTPANAGPKPCATSGTDAAIVGADPCVRPGPTHGSAPTTALTVDLRFQPSTVAGAHIGAGSTAGVTVNGQDVAYHADAQVSNLDLQHIGQEFKVPALATDQYRSSINGHLIANGRGTTPKDMDLTASGR